MIIGCGGSGKTHLANQLAGLHELPLTHLDAVYYDTDWNPLPSEKFRAIQQRIVAGPRWLIEGNYAGTLPIRLAAADTVIFLDLPAITCITGVLQRRWRYRAVNTAMACTTASPGDSCTTSGATAPRCAPAYAS
ncbi:hypothetical protein DFR75_1186 [Nocardia ignorata]|uniref:Topology modulation protein n=1 Tax=Nocardia ignorata TaxID=145285 RepID=A0A4R6NY43_NOCIG|nr:hypothetical protein DFR75_1186 [Nocardia ignorata]